jgi:Ca2+-binding RTX toxin-like protein
VGNEQENLFLGFDGDDEMNGRAGLDTVAYAFGINPDGSPTPATGPVKLDLAAGTAWNFGDTGQTNGDALTSIEDVSGSPRNDVLKGNQHANLIQSDAGNDTMRGRGGDDAFEGDPGNDTIFGGAGDGDFAYYLFAPRRIRANLASHGVLIGQQSDELRGTEILAGSRHDDLLLGGAWGDFLIGVAGRDRLRGRGGSDVLEGDAPVGTEVGGDSLDGGPGFDHCLDPLNVNCESSVLPERLRDELEQAQAQSERGPKKVHGIRRT